MLSTRLVTAAIGIPLLAVVIWFGGAFLAAVVAAAVFIAVLEVSIIRASPSFEGLRTGSAPSPITERGSERGPSVRQTLPLAVAAPPVLAALLPMAALGGVEWLMGGVVLLVIVVGSVFAWTRRPIEGAQDWLWGVAAGVYVGVLAAHFVLLREAPDGRDWLFTAVLTVWAADTGAYAVGRAIGRHKLAPVVSPGKTVEGGIGSYVTGFIAVFVLAEAFGLDATLLDKVALGLVLPPVILVGDLAESALKRSLNVKDSGSLVPGHGGVLDRLDSLLFALPVVYYYLDFVIYR